MYFILFVIIILSTYNYMNFEEFINKYSFINSQFIKDFYNIIKEDYIERYNEFLTYNEEEE